MSDDTRIQVARLVAEHWRQTARAWYDRDSGDEYAAGVADAMQFVLNALDGETDPDQLGVEPSVERDPLEALGATHTLLEEEQ